MKWEEFGSRSALYAGATRILNAGISRVADTGVFTLALSGGATPLGWFDELERNWRPPAALQIEVYWVDERQVPPDHPDSNYGNALRHWPSLAKLHLHPWNEELSTVPVFDQVWLGMGPDGHTASWFPGESAWQQGGDTVVLPAPRRIAPQLPRWSLTPEAVLRAREIILMFTGTEKRALFEAGIAPKADGALPISRLRAAFDRLTVLYSN